MKKMLIGNLALYGITMAIAFGTLAMIICTVGVLAK